MGMHAADTAELIFEDCRVPVSNLLGQEGKGFYHLMQKLQRERLMSIISSTAMAEGMLELTIKYTKERYIFGRCRFVPAQNLQDRGDGDGGGVGRTLRRVDKRTWRISTLRKGLYGKSRMA